MKKKVVLAYSGGLDTSYSVKYLQEELDYEVHTAVVNTGGFNEEEINQIGNRAEQLGAVSFRELNVLEEYYENCIKFLIYGNVLRNNTYPISVSAERMYQAISIVEYAKTIGAQAIAHGSTGAGNDQIRFDVVFQTLAPNLEIITPIRDLKLSRQEEVAYLQKHGININWEKAQYSINKGLWGTSVGGKETLTSHDTLPEEAYPSQLKKDTPQTIELTFEQGELKAINGKIDSSLNNIQKLQSISQDYAIGRDIHVGDTIIGIKGRVGFEAAAPMIILKAHHLLEKHTQTKWQMYWKDQLANWYGMMIHEAQFLDPVMKDIEAFLESSQTRVSGKVFIKLKPYRFELIGIESPYDLMKSKFGTYGEENNAWSSEEAKGFIKIFGNQHKIYHQTGQNDE